MQSALASIAESLVYVETEKSLGSGVIVGSDGDFLDVLTCWHILEGCSRFAVRRRRERKGAFFFPRARATLVDYDKETDLALLRVKAKSSDVIALADEVPDLYGRIYLAGHPNGLGWICVEGTLQGVPGSWGEDEELILFSGFTFGGSSGGIVTDLDCKLIGLISNTPREDYVDLQGLGYAIPITTVRPFLDRARDKLSSLTQPKS